MSPSHLSSMCTSAIKESLANVFGDKLDDLTRNFEQSFHSTLSTLQLIYESSSSNEGNKFNHMRREIPSSKLTGDKEDCSSHIVTEDGHSGALAHAEIQDQSISREEFRDNFHMGSVNRDLTMHGQSNQMVCFSPTSSGSVINNPMICTFEKSIVEQCRSNDLKTIELGLTMRKLKMKETELALNFDLNNLERSKLAMGVSKASFKAEKFKTQLEDMRHGELNRKCIDCLIAGLLIMSFSLLYGAYVYSYERITEASESCKPSTQESSSWWTPKSVVTFNSMLHVLWCQVQLVSRMAFGVLIILGVAYLLIWRSATSSSQTMPLTFILLMLGIGCGCSGKLCVDTLGGSGYLWLLYWEILCMLHFLSVGCTSALYPILHGPVTTTPQTKKENVIFRYWIRRSLYYATMLAFLPLSCGLLPFASLGQWKDHFLLKVSGFNESEW
ncbi:protein CPR-5 isoform X2 [Gastrolobium bilobum]|nr:protein CPR-5 isoform X2 [Gastrolobium bilobum]